MHLKFWRLTQLTNYLGKSIFIESINTFVFRHGFPIFVAGTFDVNNSFHPTYLALASHEDTLCFKFFFNAISQNGQFTPEFVLADAAQSITNAAEQIFEEAKRLMCWAHAIKNIDKKLKQVAAENRAQIRDEIQMLQYAVSDKQFESGKFCF